jgi:hypothetical protein
MKQTQESVMMDTCVLKRYSETFDAMHHPVPAWTDGPVLACGLDMTGGEEVDGNGRVLVRWSATLRLPRGTMLDLRDRIRVIGRLWMMSSNPIEYQIAGPAQEGPSGLVVRLQNTNPRVNG